MRRSRFDVCQRPLGGKPVAFHDQETGKVTWRRPLSLAPVVREGVIVGYSMAWVEEQQP